MSNAKSKLLTWKLSQAFPFLLTNDVNKEQELCLTKIDTIRTTPITELSILDVTTYVQFWFIFSDFLVKTKTENSQQPLWFLCNNYMTDYYLFEILHKLTLLVTTLLTDLRKVSLKKETSELLSISMHCIGFRKLIMEQLNQTPDKPEMVLKAIDTLEVNMLNVRLHLLFIFAWKRLVKTDECQKMKYENNEFNLKEIKNGICFSTYFFDEFKEDILSELMTVSNVDTLRACSLKRWSEMLLEAGEVSEAYEVVKDESQLELYASQLKDAIIYSLPSPSKAKITKPKFISVPFSKGFDPLENKSFDWLYSTKTNLK